MKNAVLTPEAVYRYCEGGRNKFFAKYRKLFAKYRKLFSYTEVFEHFIYYGFRCFFTCKNG